MNSAPSGTYSLCREHFIDGVVVLLSQDGQFPGLFLLESFQHGFVIRLGCSFQQVVPEGFVLPRLGFAGLLELLLNLKLLGLKRRTSEAVFCSCVYNKATVVSGTLRLLGCCRTSMTCFLLSSLSLLLLYSS